MDQHRKIVTTQIIEDVVNKSLSDRVRIGDIVGAMESSGFGLTMVIFAFAVVLPTPPPIPSLFAIPLLFFAMQMFIGYQSPKLPKFIAKISVKRRALELIVRKSSPYIDKVEKILRPRLQFMTYPLVERVIGGLIFILAIFISIPIPFSNFFPGAGVLLISFGLIGKDGVFVIAGIGIGIIGIIISMLAIFFGLEIFSLITNFFS